MAKKNKDSFFSKILTQNERVIAVDVGTRYVKIAALQKRKEGIETTVLDAEPISYISARGDISPVQVSAALTTILERNNIKNASFISILPLEFVSVKRFEVPSVSAEEIKQIVPFEAEKLLPFSLERAVLDFDFIPLAGEKNELDAKDELPEPTSEKAKEAKKAAEKLESSGKKSIVTLAAVRQAVIPKFLELCNVKGCRQKAIDVSAFALYNAFVFTLEHSAQKAEAASGDIVLIDIGALRTDIIIISSKNNELIFTRSINFGGDKITDMLAKELNISFEEAEKIKCSKELDDKTKKIVDNNLENTISPLIDNIEKSLKYAKKTGLSEKQKNIWLTGGTSSLPNVLKIIEDKLKLPTRVFNPLPSVNAEVEKFPPQIFAGVIGSALRMINEVKIKVDLLPVDITKLQQIAIRKKRFIQLGIAVGIIISLLLIIFGFKVLFTSLERQKLRAEYRKLIPLASKVDSLEKRNETLRIAVEKMKGLTDRKTSWTQVLKIISDSINSNIWVKKISVDKKNYLTIDAYSIGMDYIAFKNKLNHSIRFNNVQIVTSQKDRSGRFISFKLRCKVVPDYKYMEEFQKLRNELLENLKNLNPTDSDAQETTNEYTKTEDTTYDNTTTNIVKKAKEITNTFPKVKKKLKPIFVPKVEDNNNTITFSPKQGANVVKGVKNITNELGKLEKNLRKKGIKFPKDFKKLPPKLQKLILEKKKQEAATKEEKR